MKKTKSKPPIAKVGLTRNIFVRELHFENEGDEEPECKYKFKYLSLLVKGRLKTIVDDSMYFDHTAPHMLFSDSGKKQKLIALEDDTVIYNIHVIRDIDVGDGDEIMEENSVPMDGRIRRLLNHLIEK